MDSISFNQFEYTTIAKQGRGNICVAWKGHIVDYEKKTSKVTWLRCKLCNSVIAWLERRQEGNCANYTEKQLLK